MFFKLIQTSVVILFVNSLHVKTTDVPNHKNDLEESLKKFSEFLNDINAQIPKTDAKNKTKDKNHEWTFEEYMKKFKPAIVKGLVDKYEIYQEVNLTEKDKFDKIYKGIDETDELLTLRVENGNPKVYSKDGRRAFRPFGDHVPWDRAKDSWQLKPRFMELIKQAIYQTRDRMVIMQLKRKKYRNSALYKMGFLFSKTDHTCKLFCSVAYKAFKACSMLRQDLHRRHYPYQIVESEERLLDLWFDRDLLVDLIRANDKVCRAMLEKVTSKRKEQFDKEFIN